MDVNNREEKERKLVRELSRIFGERFESVMDLLGDPPNIANVPPEYWRQFSAELVTAISNALNETFYEQFTESLEEFGLSADTGQASEAALDFVRRYSFNLVKDIEATTITALRKEINFYFETGDMSINDLAGRLYRWYSPVRAEMIAITETTRAAVQGELDTVMRIAAETGTLFEPVWQTANDERVCPICGPRHDKVIDDDFYPPAHPRCRCWVNHRIKDFDNG